MRISGKMLSVPPGICDQEHHFDGGASRITVTICYRREVTSSAEGPARVVLLAGAGGRSRKRSRRNDAEG